MAKSAEDRYASAAEVQQDLERALASPSRVDVRVVRRRDGVVPTVRQRRAAAARRGRRTASAIAAENVRQRARSDADADERRRSTSPIRRRRLRSRSLRRQRLLTRRRLSAGRCWLPSRAVVFVLARRCGTRRRRRARTEQHARRTRTCWRRGRCAERSARRSTSARATSTSIAFPRATGARAVHARLEGFPGVDLVLELFDAQGRRLAKSDARGRGLGEWLQPTSIGPDEAYLAVREVWIEGTKPTANALDPYTLTARWGPPQPGWEIEPNDWPAAATPLPADGKVRGYLGSAEDRDWFADHSRRRPGLVMGKVNAPRASTSWCSATRTARRIVNQRGAGRRRAVRARRARRASRCSSASRASSTPKKDPKEQDARGARRSVRAQPRRHRQVTRPARFR